MCVYFSYPPVGYFSIFCDASGLALLTFGCSSTSIALQTVHHNIHSLLTIEVSWYETCTTGIAVDEDSTLCIPVIGRPWTDGQEKQMHKDWRRTKQVKQLLSTGLLSAIKWCVNERKKTCEVCRNMSEINSSKTNPEGGLTIQWTKESGRNACLNQPIFLFWSMVVMPLIFTA